MFRLLGHHQVEKFYETKYIVADVEISSGQNLYMKYKLCMNRYGSILGGGHLPWALSLLVLGEGGSGWRIAGLNASHLRQR